MQGQGHGADGAHVGSHFVPAHTVAARHPAQEPSLLVVQRHREAVDLQLRHVGDFANAHLAEDPRLELAQLFLAVGVVEAEHGHAVGEGRELLGRLLADPLRGAVGRDQVGVLVLQVLQLPLEAVVLRVRDLGRAAHVVELLVPPDLLPEPARPLRGPFAGRGRVTGPRSA